MIQADTTAHPEFRDGIFRLAMNIIKHCSSGLFAQQSDSFTLVVDLVLFAMSHEKPDLMELGNESMFALCCTLAEQPAVATIFYKHFFTRCIRETLAVLTDYRHMAGFKMQGQIVMLMLQAVDSDQIIDPSQRLADANGLEHTNASNKEFAMFQLKELICQMFPNLNTVQVESFIIRLFNTVNDWPNFKVALRDLLVSMKKFSSSDDDFYREEKEVSAPTSYFFRLNLENCRNLRWRRNAQFRACLVQSTTTSTSRASE